MDSIKGSLSVSKIDKFKYVVSLSWLIFFLILLK